MWADISEQCSCMHEQDLPSIFQQAKAASGRVCQTSQSSTSWAKVQHAKECSALAQKLKDMNPLLLKTSKRRRCKRCKRGNAGTKLSYPQEVDESLLEWLLCMRHTSVFPHRYYVIKHEHSSYLTIHLSKLQGDGSENSCAVTALFFERIHLLLRSFQMILSQKLKPSTRKYKHRGSSESTQGRWLETWIRHLSTLTWFRHEP